MIANLQAQVRASVNLASMNPANTNPARNTNPASKSMNLQSMNQSIMNLLLALAPAQVPAPAPAQIMAATTLGYKQHINIFLECSTLSTLSFLMSRSRRKWE